MTWVSAPICDACWTKVEGGREPHRVMRGSREVERCYDCHRETMSGIYVRRFDRDNKGDQ